LTILNEPRNGTFNEQRQPLSRVKKMEINEIQNDPNKSTASKKNMKLWD